jgi:hypothetical protein
VPVAYLLPDPTVRTSEGGDCVHFRELRKREVRRIPILGTWVNKGKKKGRGLCDVPRLDQGRTHAARSRPVAMITWRRLDLFCAEHDSMLELLLDEYPPEKGALERDALCLHFLGHSWGNRWRTCKGDNARG